MYLSPVAHLSCPPPTHTHHHHCTLISIATLVFITMCSLNLPSPALEDLDHHQVSAMVPDFEEFRHSAHMIPWDVLTCWNSTYLLLAFAMKYRWAIWWITEDLDIQVYKLKPVEWRLVEQLCEVLKVHLLPSWVFLFTNPWILNLDFQWCYPFLFMRQCTQPPDSSSSHGPHWPCTHNQCSQHPKIFVTH